MTVYPGETIQVAVQRWLRDGVDYAIALKPSLESKKRRMETRPDPKVLDLRRETLIHEWRLEEAMRYAYEQTVLAQQAAAAQAVNEAAAPVASTTFDDAERKDDDSAKDEEKEEKSISHDTGVMETNTSLANSSSSSSRPSGVLTKVDNPEGAFFHPFLILPKAKPYVVPPRKRVIVTTTKKS